MITQTWQAYALFGRSNPHTCVLMRTLLKPPQEVPKNLTEKFFFLSFHMELIQDDWLVENITFGADFNFKICLRVSSSSKLSEHQKDFILAKRIWNRLKQETLPISQETLRLLTLLIAAEIFTASTLPPSSEFRMNRCMMMDFAKSLIKLYEISPNE